MFNLLYYKAIKTGVDKGLIRKKDGIHLYNIIRYKKLTCEICKKPINKRNKKLKSSIDHIIPISKGGTEDFKNLRVAHRICNNKKGNK